MLRAWIEDDTFQWLITEEILDEYKEILARCEVRRDLIAHAISLIRTAAQVVPDVPGYGIPLISQTAAKPNYASRRRMAPPIPTSPVINNR
jgi:hypothetical protein